MICVTNIYRILIFLVVTSVSLGNVNAQQSPTEILVYKSPTCGCCNKWVDYLEDNGFKVDARNSTVMDTIKANLGLTDERLKSCHTALVEGYIIEGHVPAADIKKLIAEKPPLKGLTAPGMPMNSPGMASIEPKGYDVYSFDENGRVELFSRY